MKRAKLFVISAPSGCGKTTLSRKLLNDNLGLKPSISMTTRPARPQEADGVDYYFVSKKFFQDMIKKNGFLEYEDNFGYFYGTPRRFIEDNLKIGVPTLLSIDVKGAMKVKSAYPRNSVLIFVLPPSIAALKMRLSSRRSEDARAMSVRLNIAKSEMSYKDRYDYRIINDRLGAAYDRLKKIVISELKKPVTRSLVSLRFRLRDHPKAKSKDGFCTLVSGY